MSARLAAALAMAATLAAAAPSAASGALPRDFFGVGLDQRTLANEQVDRAAEFALMRASGVETVRVRVSWANAQPRPPGGPLPRGWEPVGGVATSFASTDYLMLAAGRFGLAVQLAVDDAPRWARRGREQRSPPSGPRRYAAFVEALVARYRPDSPFWTGLGVPAALRARIAGLEVWTEPNLLTGWVVHPLLPYDGHTLQGAYARLLRATRLAVRRADPRVRVLVGALAARSWDALARLYRLGGRGAFDGVALEVYGARVRDLLADVGRVRRVLRRHGGGPVPIVVAQMGWSSAAHLTLEGDELVLDSDERGQARLAAESLQALAAARRRLGISRVVWASWVTADRDLENGFDYVGLRRLDDFGVVSKPALRAYARTALALESRG